MTAGQHLGIQLYSVRDAIGPDRLDATLARLAALGFTHAEPYDILTDPRALAASLRRSGLRATTAHCSVLRHGEEAVFDAAEILGVRTVIVPMTDREAFADRDGIERLAAALNSAAGHAVRRGLRVGYHNHDFEFAARVDGRPGYELFASLLDPAVVLELDVYWAAVGGADVFELLPRLGGRVRLLHVVRDREPGNDRPFLGPDPTGRMDEVLELAADRLELPVVEVVAHHSDVWPLVEANADFFRARVRA